MKRDIENNCKEIAELRAEKQEMAEKLKESPCKCADTNKIPTSNDDTNKVVPKASLPLRNEIVKHNSNPNTGGATSKAPNTSVIDTGLATLPLNLPGQASVIAPKANQIIFPTFKIQRPRISTSSLSSSSSTDSSDSGTKTIRKTYRKIKRLQKRQPTCHPVTANPIKTAIKPEKKINMFIGSIDKSNTAQDLISHMGTFDIIVDPSEISEIPQRSDNKAFKVTIGKSYIEPLKVIWPEGVKVDIYKLTKSVSASSKANKSYKSNSHNLGKKSKGTKQPFRKPAPQANRAFQNWNQWQAYSREYPELPRAGYAYDYTWERPQQGNYSYRDMPYYSSHYVQPY